MKTAVHYRGEMPIGRQQAARIAQVASHFQSVLTLERDGVVLNAKSMLGLLSQSLPKDGEMFLVAEGSDEREATEAVKAAMEESKG
ncbi:MAG: HPr family phosphocarrier protein [Clostridia bacterium]